MSRRNRDRLEQFDDEEVVRRLLAFPAEEARCAMAQTRADRRAKGMERAVAVDLLIHTGLRLKNLRTLRLDRNLWRAGSRVFVEFTTDETKNEVELTLELPPEMAARLEGIPHASPAAPAGAQGP